MTTCTSSIGSSSGLTVITNGSSYPIAFGSVTNQLLIVQLAATQSIFFNSNVIKTGTGTYKFTISFIDMATLNTVGSVNVTNQITNSSAHLPQGNYYICIRAIVGEYSGSISFSFVTYPLTSTFKMSAYVGEEMGLITLKTTKAVLACTQPLLWEFVDGQLPKGIILLNNGMLTGTLPWLDCQDDNQLLPPSNNWYYEDEFNGTAMPWGRQYLFRAKLMLAADRTVFDVARFSIAIVANWDKMRDAFNDNFKTLTQDIATPNNQRMVVGLCDVNQDLSNTNASIPINFLTSSGNLPTSITSQQSAQGAVQNAQIDSAANGNALSIEDATKQLVANNTKAIQAMVNSVSQEQLVNVEEFIPDDKDITGQSELIEINVDLTSPTLVINWFINHFDDSFEELHSLTDEDQQSLLNMKTSSMFNSYVASFEGLEKYTTDTTFMNMTVAIREIEGLNYFALDEILEKKTNGISVFDKYTTNHNKQAQLVPIFLYTKFGEYCQLNLTLRGLV